MPSEPPKDQSLITPQNTDENLSGWLDQARQLVEDGELKQAEDIYRFLIQIGAKSDKIYNNLAVLSQMKGDYLESQELLEQALVLNPRSAQAHLNAANILELHGNLRAAVRKIGYVLTLDNNLAEAHHNMGFLLAQIGENAAAVRCYHRAIGLKNNYPDAYNNLGNALIAIGNHVGAMSAYNQAISQKPDSVDAHLNRALGLLLKGNYEQGWKEYEWRLKRKNALGLAWDHMKTAKKLWTSDTENRDETILLIGEQGLGDTIQMIRYVNTMRKRGNPITLAIQEKLHGLVRDSGIELPLVTLSDLERQCAEYWLPLFSLPGLLNVTPEEPLFTEPYIHSDEKFVTRWKSELESEARPIIAINWQGNPDAEKRGLRGRSFALEILAPLANQLQGSLLSLQKGYGSEQLSACSFQHKFVGCQDKIGDSWDFVDVSAIIANCDLVITSDTCIAHLAGAMGHPTWLLLSKTPDWRWGLEGETSFWYPSMRLFRQQNSGNWCEVVDQVNKAIVRFLAERN
jgi:Flp pilus assembly protein TadD